MQTEAGILLRLRRESRTQTDKALRENFEKAPSFVSLGPVLRKMLATRRLLATLQSKALVRAAGALQGIGGELMMECQKELIPLIEAMGIADRLIPRDEPLPDADYYCYLCSLPGLFTQDFASIPTVPCLTAPRDRMAKFGPLLAEARGRLKVGYAPDNDQILQRGAI